MNRDLVNDPEIKEIVDEFCTESKSLFDDLEQTLENLEDDPSQSQELEKFGQIIDRVMGAAKSIGLDEMATISELGKVIGYKSSQVEDNALREVVIDVLFDAIDLEKRMLEALNNRDFDKIENIDTDAFTSRMKWLSEKFKSVERSSCGYDGDGSTNTKKSQTDEGPIETQDEINKILGNFGIK